MYKKRLGIDIDGVVRPEGNAFQKPLLTPLEGAVDIINKLYDGGYHITFFTGCSWVEYDITLKWLQDNNFKFHLLICGKPIFDYIVDDRACVTLRELVSKLEKGNVKT